MKRKFVRIRKAKFLNYTFVFKKPIKIEIFIPESKIKNSYYYGYQDFDINDKFVCKENDDDETINRLTKKNFAKEIYFKWSFYINEHQSINKDKIIYRKKFFESLKEIRISYWKGN